MANNNTAELNHELATIFARVYQPLSSANITPMPMAKPDDKPTKKGRVLFLCSTWCKTNLYCIICSDLLLINNVLRY